MTPTVPEHIRNLLSADGYCRRFFVVLIEEDCTHLEAWQKVEAEFFAAFGTNKYSSFESFREIKRRWIRRYKPPQVVTT